MENPQWEYNPSRKRGNQRGRNHHRPFLHLIAGSGYSSSFLLLTHSLLATASAVCTALLLPNIHDTYMASSKFKIKKIK